MHNVVVQSIERLVVVCFIYVVSDWRRETVRMLVIELCEILLGHFHAIKYRLVDAIRLVAKTRHRTAIVTRIVVQLQKKMVPWILQSYVVSGALLFLRISMKSLPQMSTRSVRHSCSACVCDTLWRGISSRYQAKPCPFNVWLRTDLKSTKTLVRQVWTK